MAVIGTGAYTFADLAVALNGQGNALAPTVEMLAKAHPILEDIPWKEGNLITGHKTTMRTSLPSGTWRLLNSGALLGKSTKAVIEDNCAILEGYNQIDIDLADLGGNAAAFRADEDSAFVEGYGQQVAETLVYGNTAVAPGSFIGLAPRYSSLTTAGSAGEASVNVINGGGVGSDNASIYLLGWSDKTVCGIYPKGSTAGLDIKDVSTAAPVSDGAGGYYQVYMTKFQWKCGLSVRDWRYVVRIANVDVSDLAGGSPANIINLMIRALSKVKGLPGSGGVQWRFYVPPVVDTWLDIQATNKSNVWLGVGEAGGMPFTTFRKVPIRVMDQLLATETAIT